MIPSAATIRRPLAIASLCLSSMIGCSGYNGSWPQLGPTTQDARPTMEDSVAQVAAQTASPTPGALMPTAATQDIQARLSQITARYEEASRRADRQRSAVTTAIDRVGGITGSSWSLAQLELSRLNQIKADLEGLRAEASTIAGDLAAMGARGIDVGSLVTQAGTLINTIGDTMNDVAQTQASARGSLSS